MQFGGRRETILGCPTRLSRMPLTELFRSRPPLLSKALHCRFGPIQTRCASRRMSKMVGPRTWWTFSGENHGESISQSRNAPIDAKSQSLAEINVVGAEY